MSEDEDYYFFKLRNAARTYISKVFAYPSRPTEPVRHVRMVLDGNEEVHLGELDGAMCLRITGETRQTQIAALVSQDDKQIKRLTLETFRPRAGGWTEAFAKEAFTFRQDEFSRLLRFLKQIEFIDLSNQERFHIEDVSTGQGAKAIVDIEDRSLISSLKKLSPDHRAKVLYALQNDLTPEEINILLGRRKGLEEFETALAAGDWDEGSWQDFFEREQWVFGYGLDYRVMRHFDREVTVGAGGIDNRHKPLIDFLETFRDYTVIVEIKRPDTHIFKRKSGSSARAGTWEFTPEFTGAVSQILEQKAEWTNFAQHGEHHSTQTGEQLAARTRNVKAILVLGSTEEFDAGGNMRDANIKRDTFELFRRDLRGIDIVTFDELHERAAFITRDR